MRYVPTTAAFGSAVPRSLWMTKSVQEWCCPSLGHPDVRVGEDAVDALRAVLNDFVHRRDLELGLDIKQLDPRERRVWEFRSYIGTPQLRVLGCFALPNTFVATATRVRDDLEPKRGPKWTRAINEAAYTFDKLIEDYPASADTFRELVR